MSNPRQTLTEFLLQTGYQQVPLTRSGVGHFHTAGTLNGHPVAILIDTGAASTVISLALAKELGLKLQKLDQLGGGAGGVDLEIYHALEAELMLGDVKPHPQALFALDLKHVNQALAQKGERPVDVILGVDVFEKQKAVVDYASSSLFLRPLS